METEYKQSRKDRVLDNHLYKDGGKTLRKRYKCNLGMCGWCDGKKRGVSMRCPALLKIRGSKENACELGI